MNTNNKSSKEVQPIINLFINKQILTTKEKINIQKVVKKKYRNLNLNVPEGDWEWLSKWLKKDPKKNVSFTIAVLNVFLNDFIQEKINSVRTKEALSLIWQQINEIENYIDFSDEKYSDVCQSLCQQYKTLTNNVLFDKALAKDTSSLSAVKDLQKDEQQFKTEIVESNANSENLSNDPNFEKEILVDSQINKAINDISTLNIQKPSDFNLKDALVYITEKKENWGNKNQNWPIFLKGYVVNWIENDNICPSNPVNYKQETIVIYVAPNIEINYNAFYYINHIAKQQEPYNDKTKYNTNISNYYNTEFNSTLIDILLLNHIKNIKALINYLLNGINTLLLPSSKKFFICIPSTIADTYTAVYLQQDNFTANNGLSYLKEDIDVLPVVNIKDTDIIRVNIPESVTKYFLKYLYLQRITSCVAIKSLDELLSIKIPTNITKRYLQNDDFTNKQISSLRRCLDLYIEEQKYFNDFKLLDTFKNAYKLTDVYNVTEDILEKYCQENINKITSYISNKEGLWEQLILKSIQQGSQIGDSIKNQLIEDLKLQEENAISSLKLEVNRLKKELTSNEEQIKQQQEKIAKNKNSLEKFNDDILSNFQKKKEYLSEQILEAFMTNEITSLLLNKQNNVIEQGNNNLKETNLAKQTNPIIQQSLTVNDLVAVNDPVEINTVLTNLLNSLGCHKELKDFLSLILLSLYVNKCPTIIAGASAYEIANKFVIAVTGKTATIVDCHKLEDTTYSIPNLEEDIIIFDNFFTSRSRDVINLIRKLYENDKLCIVVSHYEEEVFIEPKEISNYFYPLFTNFFIKNFLYNKRNTIKHCVLTEDLIDKILFKHNDYEDWDYANQDLNIKVTPLSSNIIASNSLLRLFNSMVNTKELMNLPMNNDDCLLTISASLIKLKCIELSSDNYKSSISLLNQLIKENTTSDEN